MGIQASFSQATEELDDARVFGGIHFRTSCNVGRAQGEQVGQYILANFLQRLHGKGSLAEEVEEQ